MPSWELDDGSRLPIAAAAFALEPQIKEETLLHHHRGRAHRLLERRGPSAIARDIDGEGSVVGTELLASDLDRTIDDAFPGASLVVPPPGRFASFGMRFPDQPKRVFEAAELSEGTLRYLGLAGALHAYRLSAFVALSEPEASLHPDLLEPLARLIIRASERTQSWSPIPSPPHREQWRHRAAHRYQARRRDLD